MKLIQNHDAITIVSDITQETFEKAKRYAPQSLQLREDKNVVFAINVSACGSTNKNGIGFTGVNADGKLYTTMACPKFGTLSTADARAELEADFGMILFNLKKIEDQVTEAVGAAAAAIATVSDSIVLS